MLLVHPALSDGWNYALTLAKGNIQYWHIFGLEIERVGYQGTVIPVLVASWVLATLEKNLRKVVPSFLDNLITPLFALFITGLLAFTVIGPIGREAGSLISTGLTWLYDTLGFVGGAIFGTLYAPIVITGMHQTFIAVETQLLAEVARTGGTLYLPNRRNVKYCSRCSLFGRRLCDERCQSKRDRRTFWHLSLVRDY